MRALLLVSIGTFMLSISACTDLPRDPAGTTERVKRSHEIVLGTINGAVESPQTQHALNRLAAQLDVRVVRVSGHGEELLEDLETGKVDLVFGQFAQDSPWATKVHFGSPLSRRDKVPKDERVARFAFRHGENGWISLVEQAAR